MIVVLLAATDRQARQHARDALIDHKRDTIIPRGVEQIEGLRLTEADLVMEFPGFRQREAADEIIHALHAVIAKSGDAGPVWRKAGAEA